MLLACRQVGGLGGVKLCEGIECESRAFFSYTGKNHQGKGTAGRGGCMCVACMWGGVDKQHEAVAERIELRRNGKLR